MLQTILNYLNQGTDLFFRIPSEFWIILAAALATPFGVEAVKWYRARKDKITKNGTAVAVVYIVSLVFTGIGYLIESSPSVPPALVPFAAMITHVMSQPFYFKVAKPVTIWLGDQFAKAHAWDAQMKSAIEPADGLETPSTDFSH